MILASPVFVYTAEDALANCNLVSLASSPGKRVPGQVGTDFHRSLFSTAESPNRFSLVHKHHLLEQLYTRRCCIDRLSPQR
jgi:hypothetical protein